MNNMRLSLKYVLKKTSQEWAEDKEIYPIGVLAYELDTNKVKLFDGGHTFNQLGYMAESTKKSKIVVKTEDWKPDATYKDFPFMASIPVENATPDLVPTINFSVEDSISGVFAPVAITDFGVVNIFASKVPETEITIGSIVLQ